MPKIKMSALVSGISGKSNGSVFSKNKAGLYFRNNSVKKSVNSSSQSSQLAKFRSVGSSWRNLSDIEKQAWIDATVNFPYLDVFGDQKTLTGYQLYCKINGNRVSEGESFLNLPPVARQLPNITLAEWTTVDYFLYQPQRKIEYKAIGVNVGQIELRSGVINASEIIETGFFINFSIDFPEGNVPINNLFNSGLAFEVYSNDDNTIRVSFKSDATYGTHYELKFSIGSSDTVLTFPESNIQRGNTNYFNIYVELPNVANSKLYENGDLISASSTTGSGVLTAMYIDRFSIFTESGILSQLFSINTFSVIKCAQIQEHVDLINHGYMIDDVYMALEIKNIGGDYGTIYCPNAQYRNLTMISPTISKSSVMRIVPNSFIPFPIVTIEIVGDTAVDFGLKIFSSLGGSEGVTYQSKNRRFVMMLDYFDQNDINATSELKEKIHYATGGTNIFIYYTLYDKTNGVTYSPQYVVPRKPRIRFKAGAELSSTVN